MRLNQIIAIEKGAKTAAEKVSTEAYQLMQKRDLLEGMARRYTPLDAESTERLPDEVKLIQAKATDLLLSTFQSLTKHWDIAATKESSNCAAKADLKFGTTTIKDVPVGFLLFLEKQLVNVATQLKKAPILDPAKEWHWDASKGCYVTDSITQGKTKKVLRNHVKAEATDKHPAQVETFAEDILIGNWSKVEFSGALPKTIVLALTARVEELMESVKKAREEANGMVVSDFAPAKTIFDYLRAPLLGQ
jgi:hypothetical protein